MIRFKYYINLFINKLKFFESLFNICLKKINDIYYFLSLQSMRLRYLKTKKNLLFRFYYHI